MEPTAILLLLAALLGFGLAWLLLRRREAPSAAPEVLVAALADLKNISERVNALTELRTEQQLAAAVQKDMSQRLERTADTLYALRAEAEARKTREDETQAIVRRIEGVFRGSYARGRAGENVLAEALSALPPDMVARNFKVGGKVVEFGLVLADRRILPIDSKWPAAELLQRLEDGPEDAERQRLVKELENQVQRRAAEVAQYIDAAVTTDLAVAVLPDAVYSLCWGAAADAFQRRVVLVPYSMALPYVLALYRLHLRYAQTVDIDALKMRLSDIGRGLDEMEQILENRLARPTTMLSNAYNDLKGLVGRMRGDVAYLQRVEALEEAEAAQLPEPSS